jgi:hypothetical protein
MAETTVGAPVIDSFNKVKALERVRKIKDSLLEIEDLYYSFRDDIEEGLQAIKYQVDKILQNMEKNNVTE